MPLLAGVVIASALITKSTLKNLTIFKLIIFVVKFQLFTLNYYFLVFNAKKFCFFLFFTKNLIK